MGPLSRVNCWTAWRPEATFPPSRSSRFSRLSRRSRSSRSSRPSLMTQRRPTEPTASTGVAHRFLPLLLLLFVGSGCAALIYEVVWFQMLQLIVGSSAISLGVVLGTFMGGMCIGSLYLSKVISAKEHPLR